MKLANILEFIIDRFYNHLFQSITLSYLTAITFFTNNFILFS